MKTIILYALAAACEIGGCYAFWRWLKQGQSMLWAVVGIVVLAVFAWLLTRVDSPAAGRTFAAYGGLYIAASLVWDAGGGRLATRSLGPDRGGRVPGGGGDHSVGAARRLSERRWRPHCRRVRLATESSRHYGSAHKVGKPPS